jgi:excisionase family DNA binding protein
MAKKKLTRWYNTAEAAAYLGLHIETVRRLCRQRQIAHRRLRGYQFTKEMLDAFLRSRTVFQAQHPDPMKVRVRHAGEAVKRALDEDVQ